MHHLFVVNTYAGKNSAAESIVAALEQAGKDVAYTVYQTKGKGDATAFVRAFCGEHTEETVRVYACGGDGTAHEVANGIVGCPNASMTVYPCGSGNDFVKYYGGKDRFMDIDALLDAEEAPIDLIRINDKQYAINACHFGFDSAVAELMSKIRHKKIIGGSMAYPVSVAKALLMSMKTYCTVKADGEVLNPNGELLLCTVANGQYVGGSYRCAPYSANDDGLLEVCLVKPVSRITFLRLMNAYKAGKHLDDPRFQKYIVYRQAKCVEIYAASPVFPCSLDGEVIYGRHICAQVEEKTVRFAVPKEKDYAKVQE